MSIITIGCDPGTTSGIAVWRDTLLLSARNIRKCSTTAVTVRSSVMRWILDLLGDSLVRSDVHWVTEDQWMPQPTQRNIMDPTEVKKALSMFRSIATVREIAGRWEEQAQLCGFTVLPKLVPATWRSSFGLNSRRIKDKKRAAVDLVNDRVQAGVTGDAAEAVLIGLHAHQGRWLEAHKSTLPGYHWAIPRR